MKRNLIKRIGAITIVVAIFFAYRFLTAESNRAAKIRAVQIAAAERLVKTNIDSPTFNWENRPVEFDFGVKRIYTYFYGTIKTNSPESLLLYPEGELDGGGLSNLAISIWPAELGPTPAKPISRRHVIYETKMLSSDTVSYKACSNTQTEDGEYFVGLFAVRRLIGTPIRVRVVEGRVEKSGD